MNMDQACEALMGQKIIGIELDTDGEIVVLQFETAFIEIEGEDFDIYIEHEEKH